MVELLELFYKHGHKSKLLRQRAKPFSFLSTHGQTLDLR